MNGAFDAYDFNRRNMQIENIVILCSAKRGALRSNRIEIDWLPVLCVCVRPINIDAFNITNVHSFASMPIFLAANIRL